MCVCVCASLLSLAVFTSSAILSANIHCQVILTLVQRFCKNVFVVLHFY